MKSLRTLTITLGVATLIAAYKFWPPAPVCSREVTLQGVRFLVVYANGATDDDPLVVSVHGRGDTPERFATVWSGFSGRARIALPQAFKRTGIGWSWFDWPSDDDALADAVGAAEEKLWRAVVELAVGRKIVFTGFSEGGLLSFAAAARHPDEIVLALPVAGGLPKKLLPRNGQRTAPVFALHGVDDERIGIDWGRSTVKVFKENAGGPAELREFPGVGHSMSPAVRQELWARTRVALEAWH